MRYWILVASLCFFAFIFLRGSLDIINITVGVFAVLNILMILGLGRKAWQDSRILNLSLTISVVSLVVGFFILLPLAFMVAMAGGDGGLRHAAGVFIFLGSLLSLVFSGIFISIPVGFALHFFYDRRKPKEIDLVDSNNI